VGSAGRFGNIPPSAFAVQFITQKITRIDVGCPTYNVSRLVLAIADRQRQSGRPLSGIDEGKVRCTAKTI
jgi:hypothetical protein